MVHNHNILWQLESSGYPVTHNYNPDLTKGNTFSKSSKDSADQIEEWFSNTGAMTKFNVITTSSKSSEIQACLFDLKERFSTGKT